MARSLWLGPGAPLSGLARVLRGEQLGDLAELLEAARPAQPGGADNESPLHATRFAGGLLLLDLGAVPLEDAGILARARTLHPSLEVAWTGRPSDLGRWSALADNTDRFLPWPVDVLALLQEEEYGEDLGVDHGVDHGGSSRRAAVTSAPAGDRGDPRRAPAAGTPSTLDPELAEIEAILAAWPGGEPLRASGQASAFAAAPAGATTSKASATSLASPTPEAPEDFEPAGSSVIPDDLLAPIEEDDDELEPLLDEDDDLPSLDLETDGSLEPLDDPFSAEPPVAEAVRARPTEDPFAHTTRTESPALLPPWYRAQVADLADLVQRAELALLRAEDDGDVAAAGAEIGRLRQFARTLGYLASPPEPGRTRIDLGVLVEEVLAGLAARPEDAADRPRFLFRAPAAVEVTGDKGLLVAALDAVLQTAAAATHEGDTVRTEVLESDAGVAEVRVDLPRGHLAGLPAERLLEPYALRDRVQGIGPNALAAAGGILVGHHGDLRVRDLPAGRLLLSLRLPVAR